MWFVFAAAACVLITIVAGTRREARLTRRLEEIASELGMTKGYSKVNGTRHGVEFNIDGQGPGGLWLLRGVRDGMLEWWWLVLLLFSDDFSMTSTYMTTALSALATFSVTMIAWNTANSMRATIRLTIEGAPNEFSAQAQTSFLGHITGDAELDEAVNLDGDPLPTLARLEPDLRRRLIDSVPTGAMIRNGVLTQTWTLDADPGVIAQEVELAVQLVAELNNTSSHIERLAHRVLHDPNPSVRTRAAVALLDQLPRHPVTLKTRQALYDGRPCLRVLEDGSSAAVFALHELEQSASLREVPALVAVRDEGEPVVAECAERALLALRHRTGGDFAGGVSVAQVDAGGLSVADNARNSGSVVTTTPVGTSL